MNTRLRGNEFRSTVVCIDSYTIQVLDGRFYNAFQPEGEHFSGLMQFLVKAEELLDRMDFPQAFSEIRSFRAVPIPIAKSPPDDEWVSGKLATFEIRILFRQNTSWQGTVTWLDTGQEESFRSVLELSLLMDSALTSLQDQPA